MIARIALPERVDFSVSQLVRDIHLQLPGAMIPWKTNGHMSFRVGQSVIQMAAPAKPIIWKNQDQVLQFSYRWPINRPEWESHSAQLVFKISGDDDPVQQARFLTVIVANALQQCPAAFGVYWKSAGHIIPRDLFCQVAGLTNQVDRIWIGVHARQGEQGTIGYTQGMAALGKQELETVNASEPPRKVASRLTGLVSFLFYNVRDIQDGQWLEQSDQQNIRLRISDQSAFDRQGPVIRLFYGAAGPEPARLLNTGRGQTRKPKRDVDRRIWKRPAFGIAVAATLLAGVVLTVAASL